MITSFFSLQFPDEAIECIEAGADWLGILTGDDNCPAAISVEQAKKVYAAIGDKASKNAIIMVRDEEKLLQIAEEIKPDILMLCDEKVFATPEFCEKAKKRVPGMKISQAIAVCGKEAVDEALLYDGIADYLILDSLAPEVDAVSETPKGIGAAGVTHDWDIDAEIISKMKKTKVVIAGGLGTHNVEAAIRATIPFGVDSLTKTTIVENGIYLRKDIEKVKEFVRLTHKTAKELGVK